MKLIKPKTDILWREYAGNFSQEEIINDIYKQIEIAGRTCYKSIGTRYFKIPLYIEDYEVNPLILQARQDGRVVCNTSSVGEISFISMEDKIVNEYTGIEVFEDLNDNNFNLYQNITYKPFIDMLINKGHTAMLEHGTVYLTPGRFKFLNRYKINKYSIVKEIKDYGDTIQYITTNYRVLLENNWLDDLQYICLPTEHHEKRVSVRFICDRGISHELVRHRVFSFAQESTRYCNYSKDKFDNQVTFIIPFWSKLNEGQYDFGDIMEMQNKNIIRHDDVLFANSLLSSENCYMGLMKKLNKCDYQSGNYFAFEQSEIKDWTAQQARAVLPNALKTEIVITGFVNDWKHFFDLRCSPMAHPQMNELSIPLLEEFYKIGLLK